MPASKQPARIGSWLALVAVALTGPLTPSAVGGDNVWTSGGRFGGSQVNGIAVDPLDPRTVYAGTAGGIFKSSDGGASWQGLNGSGSPDNVEALAILPTTPTTLYAARCPGPGVVKSIDGGLSWANANSGLNNSCVTAIAIDPSSPTTLYAGASAVGSPTGSSTEGVFRSTDGGASWRSIRSGMDTKTVLALAIDPVTPSTIYAGTVLAGVFKSVNRGDRWTAASSGLPTVPNPFVPSILMPPTIESLAVDPMSPATVYAGASLPGGLSRTSNGGASWTPISQVSQLVNAVVIDPAAPSTIYVALVIGIWRTQDGTDWRSFNDGLSDSTVTALGIDRTGTFLYAGTLSGEVFAYRYATPRLHITLPSGRVPPKVVSHRP